MGLMGFYQSVCTDIATQKNGVCPYGRTQHMDYAYCEGPVPTEFSLDISWDQLFVQLDRKIADAQAQSDRAAQIYREDQKQEKKARQAKKKAGRGGDGNHDQGIGRGGGRHNERDGSSERIRNDPMSWSNPFRSSLRELRTEVEGGVQNVFRGHSSPSSPSSSSLRTPPLRLIKPRLLLSH